MYRTAEFVSPKHPDKICDRISDKILDYCLERDPNSRVAVETMGGHGHIYVNGEITIKDNDVIPIPHLVEEVLGTSDYLKTTQVNIVQQSPEISRGVDKGGAGDQGIMVGYACNENDEYVPEEYRLARSLCKYLYDLYPYDGKTQVNRSTVNTIAKFDMGPNIKKGDKLGVISGNLRKKYDLKASSFKPEAYDLVLDYVLTEGHADTVEEAHYVMTQMDEEAIKAIINEIDNLGGKTALATMAITGAALANPVVNAVKNVSGLIKRINAGKNKTIETIKP